MEQPTITQEEQKNSGNRIIVIILAVMIVLLLGAGGFLGYQWFNRGKVIHDQNATIESQNKEIQEKNEQLQDLEKRVADLEGNGSLTKEQADDLRNQIAQLQEELKDAQDNPKIVYRTSGGGGGTSKKIEELETTIAGLEEQYNKVKSERDKLAEDNKKLTTDYLSANQEKQDLQVRNKDMENKLNLASALKMTSATLTGYRLKKNGDPVYEEKAKKVSGMKIQFTILENVVAQSGDKVAYIVIIGPNKKVMTENASNTFQYMGIDKVYSTKKEFYYSNKDTEMTADYKTKETIASGEYRAEVYIDGALAGYCSSTFK